MAIDRSTLGPVEILAVAFPGNQFKGEIVPALRELVDDGVIRILDLTFVKKELDGTVTALEVGELEGDQADSYASLGPAEEEFINDEDLADVADELEAGSSAALLVWEDRWAAKLAAAIRDAKGEVLALERVPREAVDEVLDALGEKYLNDPGTHSTKGGKHAPVRTTRSSRDHGPHCSGRRHRYRRVGPRGPPTTAALHGE